MDQKDSMVEKLSDVEIARNREAKCVNKRPGGCVYTGSGKSKMWHRRRMCERCGRYEEGETKQE